MAHRAAATRAERCARSGAVARAGRTGEIAASMVNVEEKGGGGGSIYFTP